MHVVSINGFLQNSELIYKAGNSTGDCHSQMNHVNFEKWVRDKLIPSLPTNSIVMDNAPYHSMQVDKVSSKYSVKTEIIAWLHEKGISCDEKIHKQELFSVVAANKPREKTFRVDSVLASFILSFASKFVCVTLALLNWHGPK
jgi:hypothetical protein